MEQMRRMAADLRRPGVTWRQRNGQAGTRHPRARLVRSASYLRHACASWLLGAGIGVVAVSERLGHWSPLLTLSVYAHAIRGRQRELARTIGAALK